MKHFDLLHVSEGNKAQRWFIDGVRVARHQYEFMNSYANRKDCFLTRINKTGRVRQYHCIQVSNGFAAIGMRKV